MFSSTQMRERLAHLAQPGRLGENAIDMRRDVALRHQPLAPAGEQDHRRGVRSLFYCGGHLATVDVGHAHIT